MLVAPTEPPVIKRLGQVSSVPERYGVDVLWVSWGRRWGVQRKACADFVASVFDGRIHREVSQMVRLDHPVLIVEGRWQWTVDGSWTLGRWDRFRHRQFLFDLLSRGVWVLETTEPADTVEAVRELERWSRKDRHRGPDRRPGGNQMSAWGRATNREWSMHFLQGFDGVGPELAERIVSRFGRAPIDWTVGEEELQEVEGIGPTRARRLMEALR